MTGKKELTLNYFKFIDNSFSSCFISNKYPWLEIWLWDSMLVGLFVLNGIVCVLVIIQLCIVSFLSKKVDFFKH